MNLKRIKKSNFIILLDGYDIKYKKPKISSEACISRNKTYSITLFIKASIKYKKKSIIKREYKKLIPNKILYLKKENSKKQILINKYLPIAEIPLINKKGSFVINGNIRVIIENTKSNKIFLITYILPVKIN